jgi:hypothetical protein
VIVEVEVSVTVLVPTRVGTKMVSVGLTVLVHVDVVISATNLTHSTDYG